MPAECERANVNVLGPIELIVDGQAVNFTSPRLRQLLAMLVAHSNTVISRIGSSTSSGPARTTWPRCAPYAPTFGGSAT